MVEIPLWKNIPINNTHREGEIIRGIEEESFRLAIAVHWVCEIANFYVPKLGKPRALEYQEVTRVSICTIQIQTMPPLPLRLI